jgi:hypothetical protein
MRMPVTGPCNVGTVSGKSMAHGSPAAGTMSRVSQKDAKSAFIALSGLRFRKSLARLTT